MLPPSPTPYRQLPVSIPSELVHQRPDIQAAEAQLHAASAQIGIATAQLYPSKSDPSETETMQRSISSTVGINADSVMSIGLGPSARAAMSTRIPIHGSLR